MNINKVIKIYFTFLLVLAFVATLSYNRDINQFIVNAFNSSNFRQSQYLASILDVKNAGKIDMEVRNKNLSGDLSITFSNDPEQAFAQPGSSNVKIMNVNFSAKNPDLVVKKLSFVLEGVDESNVGRVAFVDNETGNIIQMAKREGEKFVFDNFDLKVSNLKKVTLGLEVSVTSALKNNDRLRLNIGSSEDVQFIVDKKTYNLKAGYPLNGKYLTIASPRGWVTTKKREES